MQPSTITHRNDGDELIIPPESALDSKVFEASSRRGKGLRGLSPAERARANLYWPFVVPALAVYVLLFVVPAGHTAWTSLTSWRGSGTQTFVGFKNYVRLWNDAIFIRSFWNTLLIAVVCGVVIFALSFLTANILRELKHGESIQTILLFPFLLSSIAVGITFSLLFVPDGLINSSLRLGGLESLTRTWLSADRVFPVILLGIVWASSGFYILILTSGMGRIPSYYFEQAQLDGAGRFRTLWNVTIPLTWDIISIAVVFWMMGAVKIFEFVYGFAGAGSYTPAPETRTLAVQQFLTTTGGPAPQYEMGLGSAIGVVMLVLVSALVLLSRRLMRRERVEF